ncbi:nucleotidyltransferase family protein [Macrococcus capreoli]|uniref:hypothetical protein n=1 Tax=Macrococcus capreoli TaxID=2982690 RepID=UPI0021D5E17A|nr:hypothetical protein [Macrococcus sp. TMW 2.2395]MCU7558523.1 hypothetical protein [Macrococcus sp. TMW 2.2395]
MYTSEEREDMFELLLNHLKFIHIKGAVQIGSGVKGYSDTYSDIDMMVAVSGNVAEQKDKIKNILEDMGAKYIKEGMFREDIYLLIPFFDSGLEMDISIMPTQLLSVQSPLWKVIYDADGSVLEKMNELNNNFINKEQPYRTTPDIAFEFVYRYRKAMIDIKRSNMIGALSHIDIMKEFILEIQLLNEKQKLHQFKQFHLLNQAFQEAFLDLYQFDVNLEGIDKLLQKTMKLFKKTIDQNNNIEYDEKIYTIIEHL